MELLMEEAFSTITLSGLLLQSPFTLDLDLCFSMYGCYQHHKKATGDKVGNVDGDAEQGMYDAPELPQSTNAFDQDKSLGAPEDLVRQQAGTWGYIFQIMFQINAGAVMLTDCVFWFIIVPFLTIKDYNLNFLIINMHTINVVFLLGDAALNCLWFPWFRMGYFCMWTVIYVIFQWIVHACINLWWPYPFLDLSSPYDPLWFCKHYHEVLKLEGLILCLDSQLQWMKPMTHIHGLVFFLYLLYYATPYSDLYYQRPNLLGTARYPSSSIILSLATSILTPSCYYVTHTLSLL